jgi:cytoskeleton-associated protein 5
VASRSLSQFNPPQVSAKLYAILDILAKQCPTFGRSSVALCIPHLSEKLGDMKLKKPAGDALISFGESTSFQFVLGHSASRTSTFLRRC